MTDEFKPMSDEEREKFRRVEPLVKDWKVAAIAEQARMSDAFDMIDGFVWGDAFDDLEGWLLDHIESLDEEAKSDFVRIGALLYYMHLEHLRECENQIAKRDGKRHWKFFSEAEREAMT